MLGGARERKPAEAARRRRRSARGRLLLVVRACARPRATRTRPLRGVCVCVSTRVDSLSLSLSLRVGTVCPSVQLRRRNNVIASPGGWTDKGTSACVPSPFLPRAGCDKSQGVTLKPGTDQTAGAANKAERSTRRGPAVLVGSRFGICLRLSARRGEGAHPGRCPSGGSRAVGNNNITLRPDGRTNGQLPHSAFLCSAAPGV